MNRTLNSFGASPWSNFRIRRWLMRMGGAQVSDLRAEEGLRIIGRLERLAVGRGVYMNTDVSLFVTGGITVGDSVSIGPRVTIMTGSHEIGTVAKRASSPTQFKPVSIGTGSWIGAGVTVQGGVSVGQGVIIAAGAVVTEDLPDSTLCGGIPARVLRHLE